MKYFYIFLALVIVFVFVGACKSSKKTSSLPSKRILVELAKGKCYGKCKVYAVRFYEDNTMQFVGERNVDSIGTFSATISTDAYSELKKRCEAVPFADFNDEYLSGAKDLPELQLTYAAKTIRFHRSKAPEELLQLVDFIDELSFSQDLKRAN